MQVMDVGDVAQGVHALYLRAVFAGRQAREFTLRQSVALAPILVQPEHAPAVADALRIAVGQKPRRHA